MKNILVVFTGGTIGSAASEGIIDTSAAAAFKLIRQFEERDENHQRVRFTPIEPLRLLSENLAPAVWQTLIAAIETEQPDRYDGIIITHGTDTLAYTAAALSFYFHALGIPLLLVSSDYPLDDARANGLGNFICAVEFIRQQGLAGVFVPYRNQGQTTQVHRGSRLACSLQLSGDFFSVRGKSFMQYENGRFSAVDSLDQERSPIAGGDMKAEFSGRILMIKPYPGLNYAHFNLDGVDAVLHDLYHSGTACASAPWGPWGENYSLVEFIKRCREQHIKVYLAPSIKSADAYQSTRALMEQGAEMIWNMSMEAAYVKLMLAYGNFGDARSIMAFIDRDIAGEHVR
jgi:L-asparaginase